MDFLLFSVEGGIFFSLARKLQLMGAFLRLAIIAVGSPENLRRNFWFSTRKRRIGSRNNGLIFLWENEKARRVFLDLVCT